MVGLVDKDKRIADVTYLRQFSRVHAARSGPDCRYRIYQHEHHLTHYLIVLDPACDTWLFEAAHAAGLPLAAIGLPPTLPAFIDFMKQEGLEDSPAVGRLLYAIKQAPRLPRASRVRGRRYGPQQSAVAVALTTQKRRPSHREGRLFTF